MRLMSVFDGGFKKNITVRVRQGEMGGGGKKKGGQKSGGGGGF